MKRFFSIAFFTFTVFTLFFLYSCKKKANDSIPVIEMSSPIENASFTLPDSIYVKSTITDSRNITSIRVQLVDEDYIPVLPAYFFAPNTNSVEVDFYYPLDSTMIKTGVFFLLVRADNENQFRNKYQPIAIAGYPIELKQTMVITSPSDNLLQVSGFEEDGEPYPLFDIAADFCDSDIDYQNQLLFVAGKNILNVAAYDISSGDERWRIPEILYKPMHNDNCLHFGENNVLYVSYNYQNIFGYDVTGKITFDAFIEQSDAPGTIINHREFVIVDFQKKNSSQPFIRTYYSHSGAEKQSKLSLMKVVEFIPYSNDSIVVCGNEGGLGRIFFYDIKNNINIDIHSFNSPIGCIAAINSQNLLVGLDIGLFLIDLNTGISTPLLQEGSYSLIRFEKISSQLYLVDGNEIQIFNYPKMEYQKTIVFPDTILDILLNYSI